MVDGDAEFLYSQHMIPYLPQLHSFLQEPGARLPPDDLLAITEGIGHILASIQPPEEGVKALSMFCTPLLEQIFRITSATTDKAQLRLVASRLNLLEFPSQLIEARCIGPYRANAESMSTFDRISSIIVREDGTGCVAHCGLALDGTR